MLKQYVTKECRVMFGVRHKVEIHIKAGLRVKLIEGEPMADPNAPMYFLDEFPVNLPAPYTSFPMDSFTRHDAEHYGIRLTAEQVEEV